MEFFAPTYNFRRFARVLATALILCLWIVLPASAQSEKTEKENERVIQFIEKGLKAFDRDKYDAAIKQFNQALKLDPKSTWALNLRGNTWMEMGRLQKAVADYDQCLLIAPHYAAAYRNRALAYFRLGDFDRTRSDLDQAIHFDPKHPGAYLQRGRLKSAEGDYNGAMADYRKAMESGLSADKVYLDRGKALFGLGNHVQAYRDLSQHLANHPQDTAAMAIRARCRIALGLYKGLEADFKVIDDPNVNRAGRDALANEKARFLAAVPHDDIRDSGRALVIAEGLAERHPKNHYYLDTLAMALAAEQQYPKAALTQMKAINRLKSVPSQPETPALIIQYTERLHQYKSRQPYRLRPTSGPKYDRIVFYNWKSSSYLRSLKEELKEELAALLLRFSPPLMLTDQYTRRADLVDLAVSCRVRSVSIRETKADLAVRYQVEVPSAPVVEKPVKTKRQLMQEEIEALENEIKLIRQKRKNALALAKSSGGADAPVAKDNRAMSVVEQFDHRLKTMSNRKAELETSLAMEKPKPEPPQVKKELPPPKIETRTKTVSVPAKAGEILATLQLIDIQTGKYILNENLKGEKVFAPKTSEDETPDDETIRESLVEMAAQLAIEKLMVHLGVDEGYPNLLD